VQALDTAGLDTAPAAATDGTVQRLESTEISVSGRYKYLPARFRYLGCGSCAVAQPLPRECWPLAYQEPWGYVATTARSGPWGLRHTPKTPQRLASLRGPSDGGFVGKPVDSFSGLDRPANSATGHFVTNCYTPLASCRGAEDRCPLRHWLRSEATWGVLAAAGLTHPRTVAHRARCLGLKPHWSGRVRVWSWAELLQLAQPEVERLVQLESQRRALHRRAGR